MKKVKVKKKLNTSLEQFSDIIKNISTNSGVYLFKDKNNQIIYIGKAKNLKKRVKSYFLKEKKRTPKTTVMLTHLKKIETIVVQTEMEALILETNLIKKYRPRYNIRMRDDKNYVYIKITLKDDFPRIYTVRKIQKDGAKYFGPYSNLTNIQKTFRLIKKIFPFRSCRGDIIINKITKNKEKPYKVITKNIPVVPCLDYHIKRCKGPCLGIIRKQDYLEIIKQLISFLEGKEKTIIKNLKLDIERAVKKHNFEKAALVRDKLLAVNEMLKKQIIISTKQNDLDIIASSISEKHAVITICQVRVGKLLNCHNFSFSINAQTSTINDLMGYFLQEYYPIASFIPRTILIEEEPDFLENHQNLIKKYAGHPVEIIMPQKGYKYSLIKLAKENTENYLKSQTVNWQTENSKIKKALTDLQNFLQLKLKPDRIECYDISHIQGTNKVGSMIVFEDGKPLKNAYRRFKIKSLKEGINDDYKSLAEILTRRFKNLIQKPKKQKKDESFEKIPNLIIIDGGKGQLNTVLKALNHFNLPGTKIISLAKRAEEIFIPDKKNPTILPANSEALYLIQRIRDEAHRFAISYQKNIRSKKMINSVLDEIPGIGKLKRKLLLQKFGSIKGIKEANNSEIIDLIGLKATTNLKDYI